MNPLFSTSASNRLHAPCLTPLLLCCLLLTAPASANGYPDMETMAAPEENPGALDFQLYVPADLTPDAALVVVLHGCDQRADEFAAASGWLQAAADTPFALLAPRQREDNNRRLCFNWFSDDHSGREGSETRSILNAVDAVLAEHLSESAAVYVTGLSAGGAMTSNVLAAHPERFSGGGIVAGIPTGCAATAAGALWCMQTGDTASSAQLARRLRERAGGDGPWPRVSIWHGTDDRVVRRRNQDALMRQWTEAHGLDRDTPSEQRFGMGLRRRYGDHAEVETWTVDGLAHGMPVDAEADCGHETHHVIDIQLCAVRHLLAHWGLADSVDVDAIPSGWSCTEHSTSTHRHVQDERARIRLGLVYARGSGDPLGPYLMFGSVTVSEHEPGYWVRGECP